MAPRIFQESAAPGPRREHVGERAAPGSAVVIDVSYDVTYDVTPTPVLLAPPPTRLLLAEPQPPSMAASIPMEKAFQSRPADCQAGCRQSMGEEPWVSSPVELPGATPWAPGPALASLQS